jgi:hypothetical protein
MNERGKRKRKRKPRSRPLTCTVTRDGVLRIEIGVDTLTSAALRSPFAWRLADERNPDKPGAVDPCSLFAITDARGFADDVIRELLREAEDGSSLLTDLLDKATQKAIEDGSEFFEDKDGEP